MINQLTELIYEIEKELSKLNKKFDSGYIDIQINDLKPYGKKRVLKLKKLLIEAEQSIKNI